ncbi:hypothetical protein PG994_006141 [Apiospora phragmitis]|uniref:Clr5 domain-containing protein n=1 Tax=Apiospora phragmitis TaxID=2905665 RepID=A0ABR1VE79_9PEZI
MRGSHQTLTVRKAPYRPKDPNAATSFGKISNIINDDNNNNNNNKLKTNCPATTMSHAQQYARPFDWSQRQGIITQLYIFEDRPLKEVAEIMRDSYQFHATYKMYKDHFRKWNLRKNLNSKVFEDFLIRPRQQNTPPTAHSPNGTVVVRNLSRRMTRYVRSGSGGSPNAEPAQILYGMVLPRQVESPGSLKHAERSSTSSPLSGPLYRLPHILLLAWGCPSHPVLGCAYDKVLYRAYGHQVQEDLLLDYTIGIARNFLHEKRSALGFALLNHCFGMFKGMLDSNPWLDPNPWLILAAFYGAYDLARFDPELAVNFMGYIDQLTTVKGHAFHELFTTLRQSGSDGVLAQFERVILECFMDTMAGSFRDKKMVLDIMRSFSIGFIRAYPKKAMPSIEVSRATVQEVFDNLKDDPDSVIIKPIPAEGQPSSAELEAIVKFPKSPMEDFLHGWANTHPASTSPSPSTTSSVAGTTIASDTDSEDQGSNRADSPPAFDPFLVEIILNKVVEETSVELYSGNLSVTARLMDLKGCFGNLSGQYSDIEELRKAYADLMGYYAENASIYIPH